MKTRMHLSLPAAEETEFMLELWMTKKFTTYDIARFLRLHEATVERTIHAARDIARLICREGKAAK